MTTRIQVHAPATRLYTTDAARRTGDTRISAETAARNPNMFGTRWVGDLQPVGAAVAAVIAAVRQVKDQALQKAALSMAFKDIACAEYGTEVGAGLSSGTMRPGAFGSLSTGAHEGFNVGAGADPADINDANREFWDRAAAAATSDALPPRGAPVTPADINRMNAAHYASVSHVQPFNRPWGKG
jgi:hypothetical protein